MRPRSLLALILAFLTIALCACAGKIPVDVTPSASVSATAETEETVLLTEEIPVVIEASVREIDREGNVTLSLRSSDLYAAGFSLWDIVTVKPVSGKSQRSYDLPLCLSADDVSFGSKTCVLSPNGGADAPAVLSVSGGDFALESRWVLNAADTGEASVLSLTLKEQGGYYDAWIKRSLKRTNKREDYAHLSDEEYANFRAVLTTGMGPNKLFRSTSPFNPSYNRSHEADAAARAAAIATVIDLTDDQGEAARYAGYKDTYCSGLPVFTRAFVMDFLSETFEKDAADALRFMAQNEAPFLVHCMEGKDRTGFFCALLEAFMGASPDEIVADYMRSYENFYGVKANEERWGALADANIRKTLPAALGLSSLHGGDLKKAAENYMKQIGLTDGEIALIRSKLA